MNNSAGYHTTVLLHEGVEALEIVPGGIYVDATYGGGGHSREILRRIGERGHLIAIDQDAQAFENEIDDPRLICASGNFRFVRNFIQAEGFSDVDGVLADLGVSGHHFDAAERGFSFRYDAPLDMRMNRKQERTAEIVVNSYEESQLKGILREFGETTYASKVAGAIVRSRNTKGIKTTTELQRIVRSVVPSHKAKSEVTKVFQAIRMEVNDELESLRLFLVDAAKFLKKGGRLVVISYHSLEDRLVKHFMRSGNFDDRQERDVFGHVNRPLTPMSKVKTPTDQEVLNNPRARSAKMRIAIKN